MRSMQIAIALILSITFGNAYADSDGDQTFSNAALNALHDLAVSSYKLGRATEENDNIGCDDANKEIKEAAHEALDSMNNMSFRPHDAIDKVSQLLRLDYLTSANGCTPDTSYSVTNLVEMTAGQAIMSLRWDYAIGDSNWFQVRASGGYESTNPLRFADSLRNEGYSWVDIRPKGMIMIVEEDWHAEMASHQVDDASIQNSGNNLEIVEVGYRKNAADNPTIIYFYKTKGGALAAVEADKQKLENDKKATLDQKAADVEWATKLASLPYMDANHDIGFKIIYSTCTKVFDVKGVGACEYDNSFDWSDRRSLPYNWFSDIQACEDAQRIVRQGHAADALVLDCVPAPKVANHALSGYQMLVSLAAPSATFDDVSYADLREGVSEGRSTFDTFASCEQKVGSIYYNLERDLRVDESGILLDDKSRSINLQIDCVRTY